jgi:hypothetical protein
VLDETRQRPLPCEVEVRTCGIVGIDRLAHEPDVLADALMTAARQPVLNRRTLVSVRVEPLEPVTVHDQR